MIRFCVTPMATTVCRASSVMWLLARISVRGRAERTPKADATELAPRNRLCDPPAWRCHAGGSMILSALLSFHRSRFAHH
jgi:hypothetical protein